MLKIISTESVPKWNAFEFLERESIFKKNLEPTNDFRMSKLFLVLFFKKIAILSNEWLILTITLFVSLNKVKRHWFLLRINLFWTNSSVISYLGHFDWIFQWYFYHNYNGLWQTRERSTLHKNNFVIFHYDVSFKWNCSNLLERFRVMCEIEWAIYV